MPRTLPAPQSSRSPRTRSYKLGIPPRVAEHVRRDRLLAALSESHRRTPLTWIMGLPGSGKTSLVARWVEESKQPAVGYRLDADDADGVGWIDALRDSLVDPDAGHDALPVWSPENQADVGDFARPFFAVLARAPLTLVLDDCHRVGDDAAIFAMLADLHEVAGDSLRAVIISRREPPPILARGMVGGWLALVDDLRLSGAEVLAVARAAGGVALREEDKRALDGADGWLAHVLALCRRPGANMRLSGDATAGQRVGDFLAAELLASVPKEKRAGLRRLAELPEIPASEANAAISAPVSPEVARLLATLFAQRYFVDFARDRYRLHDLLRMRFFD